MPVSTAWKVVVAIAGLMILLGIGASIATGFESVTSLLPSFIGFVIGGLGALAAKFGKGPLIGALVLSLIGAGGPISRLAAKIGDGSLEFGVGTFSQIGFVVLALGAVVTIGLALGSKTPAASTQG